jgi:hypothetical protein
MSKFVSKPLVSVYAAAIRPQLWMRLYDSLTRNEDVNFELICVGHVSPDYSLPKNLIHIYSPTKPVQCAEIGFRNCHGEYSIQAFDDLVFSPHCLDILYKKIRDNKYDFTYLPCCISQGPDGKTLEEDSCRFWPGVKESPVLPLCGMYKTSILHSLGGRDIRFIRSYADVDLAMRFYEQGGRAEICFDAIIKELPPPGTTYDSGLNWIGSQTDRPKLLEFWTLSEDRYYMYTVQPKRELPFYCKQNSVYLIKKRSRAVLPFIDDEILTKTQGANDGWK